MSVARLGGCQCGAVRYSANGEPLIVALCHCAMCRRAHASPMVAWAMFKDADVTFVTESLRYYNSSPQARRGFCRECGTQLSFWGEYVPGLIDLSVGSFDDADSLVPDFHYWDSKRLPWLQCGDSLPRHAEFPPLQLEKTL